MTIGRRLTLGFLSIAAMAAVLTAYNLHLSRQIGRLRWTELPMEHIIGQVEGSQWETVFAVSSASVSLDPIHANTFERSVIRVEESIASYRELIDTKSERLVIDEYSERWDRLKATGRRILSLAEQRKNAEDTFFEHVDLADDIIDNQIQARFLPSDPALLRKEQLVREVEVSVWEAIHAAQQYTSLNEFITRAGHDQSTFAELMEKQFLDVEEFWEPYRELAQTPAEREAVATFDAAWADAVRRGRSVVSLHDQISTELSILDDHAASCDEIVDTQIFPAISERVAARDRAANIGQSIAIVLGAGAILGATIIGWLLTRSVCVPIDRLRQATAEVAQGHLNHRIESQAADEIGVVSRAFDSMTTRLAASSQSLRATNEQLTGTAEQLLRVNSSLKDFVYIASHDLREPLRKISSFGELLSDSLGGTLSEDDQENLDFMISGANRMTEMVEGLLAYSRLNNRESGQDTINLNETLAELQELELATMLEETGGVIELPSPLPEVMGTRSEIRQLLQNLLSNAVKYRHEGTAPHVVVNASPAENGMLRVAVSDNGIGIPEEHRDAVFKMFRRLHTRDEYSGTGIGLAVCMKIVEKHEGSIGIEPNEGSGTTVWFTIPLASTQTRTVAAAA